MRMRINLAIISLFIAVQIQAQSNNNSFKSFLANHFDETEIESILLLKDFFEKELSAQFKCKSTDVYRELIKHKSSNFEDGLEISFKEQQEIYQALDPLFFMKNWAYGVTTKYPTKVSYIYLNLRQNSAFLKALSNARNEHTEFYAETFKIAGAISPSMEAHLAVLLKEEDVRLPEVQLMLIIHYLTLNDYYKRKDRI